MEEFAYDENEESHGNEKAAFQWKDFPLKMHRQKKEILPSLRQWDFCNSLDSCLIMSYTVLVYIIQYKTERRWRFGDYCE